MNHVDVVVQFLIAMMVSGVLIWGVDQAPLPEPAKGWAKAAFVLSIALVFLRKLGFV